MQHDKSQALSLRGLEATISCHENGFHDEESRLDAVRAVSSSLGLKMKRLKTCVGEMAETSQVNLHTSKRIIFLTRSKRKTIEREKSLQVLPGGLLGGRLLGGGWDQIALLAVFEERLFPSRTNGFCLRRLGQIPLIVLSTPPVGTEWLSRSRNQISAADFHYLPVHCILRWPNPLVGEIYDAVSICER